MEAPLAGLVVDPFRAPLAHPWQTGHPHLPTVILFRGGVPARPGCGIPEGRWIRGSPRSGLTDTNLARRSPTGSDIPARAVNLHNENPTHSLSGSSPTRTRERRYQWSDAITTRDARTHGRTDRRTDGRTDGQTHRRTDGRTDGRMQVRMYARMYVRMYVRT